MVTAITIVNKCTPPYRCIMYIQVFVFIFHGAVKQAGTAWYVADNGPS